MNEYVRIVDKLEDADEAVLEIGVDHDMISLRSAELLLRFDLEGAEELGRALVSAAWECGLNCERMRQEAAVDP